MFHTKVLADSICKGSRLVTFTATFPRSILTEFYTHALDPVCVRKNLSSSRAIPTAKLVDMIITEPFVPNFALNKPGMQAGDPLEEHDKDAAEAMWESHKLTTLQVVGDYQNMKVHKQYVNRLLEPWVWCTAIITATDWTNFFAQRYHSKAEPSFQKIARMMWEAMEKSTPNEPEKEYNPLSFEFWHLPLCAEKQDWQDILRYLSYEPVKSELTNNFKEVTEIAKKVSAARCARVSYLTHEGIRDIEEDLKLFEFLTTNNPGHWSPLEHQCTPAKFEEMSWKPEQLAVHYKLGGNTFFLEDRPVELQNLRVDGICIAPKRGELGYVGAYRGWKPFRHEFPAEIHTTFTPPDED